ncbi:MAG: jacalin-like lectin [Verrucomicrobiota bacterium]
MTVPRASAIRWPLAEGKTGINFQVVLPPMAHLSRVYVHAGHFIDGLQMEYASPSHRGLTGFIGGVGGQRESFEFREDDELVAITGSVEKVVTSLQFHTLDRESPLFGIPTGESFGWSVDRGFGFLGFYGRAGYFLEAVGLVMSRTSAEEMGNGEVSEPRGRPQREASFPSRSVR